MRSNTAFSSAFTPSQMGRPAGRKFGAERRIAQGEFISPEHFNQSGFPARREPGGAGKNKMRTLGTVQLPTEAFMAVLKLDEE